MQEELTELKKRYPSQSTQVLKAYLKAKSKLERQGLPTVEVTGKRINLKLASYAFNHGLLDGLSGKESGAYRVLLKGLPFQYRSLEVIAQEAQVCTCTVKSALRKLEAAGLLARHRVPNSSCVIAFTDTTQLKHVQVAQLKAGLKSHLFEKMHSKPLNNRVQPTAPPLSVLSKKSPKKEKEHSASPSCVFSFGGLSANSQPAGYALSGYEHDRRAISEGGEHNVHGTQDSSVTHVHDSPESPDTPDTFHSHVHESSESPESPDTTGTPHSHVHESSESPESPDTTGTFHSQVHTSFHVHDSSLSPVSHVHHPAASQNTDCHVHDSSLSPDSHVHTDFYVPDSDTMEIDPDLTEDDFYESESEIPDEPVQSKKRSKPIKPPGFSLVPRQMGDQRTWCTEPLVQALQSQIEWRLGRKIKPFAICKEYRKAATLVNIACMVRKDGYFTEDCTRVEEILSPYIENRVMRGELRQLAALRGDLPCQIETWIEFAKKKRKITNTSTNVKKQARDNDPNNIGGLLATMMLKAQMVDTSVIYPEAAQVFEQFLNMVGIGSDDDLPWEYRIPRTEAETHPDSQKAASNARNSLVKNYSAAIQALFEREQQYNPDYPLEEIPHLLKTFYDNGDANGSTIRVDAPGPVKVSMVKYMLHRMVDMDLNQLGKTVYLPHWIHTARKQAQAAALAAKAA